MKPGDIVICKNCPGIYECIGQVTSRFLDGDWGFKIIRRKWEGEYSFTIFDNIGDCFSDEKHLQVLSAPEELLLL